MRLDIVAALAALIVFMAGTTSAEARRHRQSDEASYSTSHSYSRSSARQQQRHRARDTQRTYASRESHSGVGPRPAAWCGWWMRTQRGGGPEFNLAANWRRYGSHSSGPQVGAVVVWPHHVGEIVGRAANGQWLVRSGNDSGRVQTRARSVAGAVFRI